MSEWNQSETAVLAAAVSRAPSVHNTQPWRLELRGREASILERTDISLPRHDLLGRDRLISCGAALTNLRLAVRRLGWSEHWQQFPDSGRPNEIGRVCADVPLAPDDNDLSAYRAIRDRASHRARFGPEPVPGALVRRLVTPHDLPGVAVQVVHSPTATTGLAHVLHHAALIFRHDRAYQRELAAWTAHGDGDGLLERGGRGTLPWTGLVTGDTAVPDEHVLAERLATETHLLVITVGDGRSDHLHAGMALEQVWLAATAAGLGASVITQPLHLPEVRAGLIERLDLAGYPQALLRVGMPTEVPEHSPRRSFADLLHPPAPTPHPKETV
ncbi:nitroreductase family protein [Actinokineospora sp. PR83]|uniref:Acg family FMN-binding oxidoreductase n=1 Tax=Actinokineospora sp. PR83 TaxID=2884908 RepID=UPI001F3121F4|nr:nitroreductase family protein [Actinokineospora sp. PR83]MCG8917488.1 nitroreductase family protein [Actinokineospora sp. PR83]